MTIIQHSDQDDRPIVTVRLRRWALILTVLCGLITVAGVVIGAVRTIGTSEFRRIAPPLIKKEVTKQVTAVRVELREEQARRDLDMQHQLQAVEAQLAAIQERTTTTQRAVEKLVAIELANRRHGGGEK